MNVMAAEGRGFVAVPTMAAKDAMGHYGFQTIGKADECRVQFHAITAEPRIVHPAVALITGKRLERSTQGLDPEHRAGASRRPASTRLVLWPSLPLPR